MSTTTVIFPEALDGTVVFPNDSQTVVIQQESTPSFVVLTSDSQGPRGLDGEGSSPVLSVIASTGSRVFKVVDWVGGAGSKPAANLYVGPAGLVADIGSAVNLWQNMASTDLSDGTTLVTLTGSQTLVNKILTAPVINSPTGIVKGDVGLGNVDNTSDATKNSAAVSLTNKSIDAAQNTITNISTGMFAAGVFDTDTTLSASSSSRIASQSAVKSYVDNLITGLNWKAAVACATTVAGGNITLSGEQTIDGVLTSASRVLVKNQTDQTQNGIYVSAAGAWSRAPDDDAAAELHQATVFVSAGAVHADTQWTCTADSIVLGSTNIVFAQVSGAGTYSVGANLVLTGNQFSLATAIATTSMALGGATIGTNALAVTGTAAFSSYVSAQAIRDASAATAIDLTTAGSVDIVSGRVLRLLGTAGVLSFNADTGLSRDAATGLLAGNGTAGDFTGYLKAASVRINSLQDQSGTTKIDNSVAAKVQIPSGQRLQLHADGAASASALFLDGAIFTGGDNTTRFPLFLIQPSNANAITSWDSFGTVLGINTASGFVGKVIDIRANGSSTSGFILNSSGQLQISGAFFFGNSSRISTANRSSMSSPADGTWFLSGNSSANGINLSFPSGTAYLQFGALDAAAPVAQILGFQNVVAGTANTAGVASTIRNSAGTGTGLGGDIVFQYSPHGSTGSTQNAWATALTINGDTAAVSMVGSLTTSFSPAANQSALTVSGTILTSAGSGTANLPHILIQPSGTTVKTNWSTSGTVLGINIPFAFGGNVLDFSADGTNRITIDAQGKITSSGSVFGLSIIAQSPNFLGWVSRSLIGSPADGVVTLFNAARTDFSRLQFGGISSSFPSIRRTGTVLNVRLADDSADSPITVSYINTVPVTFANLPAAATAGNGARAFITDSNTTTFNAAAAGGGANNVPVFSDGAAWKIG